MPNIPWQQPTVAQLTLIGVADTSQIVNTHFFLCTGVQEAILTSDAAAITWSNTVATAWVTSAKSAWMNCHGSDYTLQLVKAQVIERPGNWRHKLTPVELVQTTGNVGGVSGGAAANQVSAVVKWRTTSASKHTRGRSYIGPTPSSHTADGTIPTGGRPVYEAYITAMIGQFGAAGANNANYTMCIYSRPYNQGEYGYPQGRNPTRTWFYPPDYAGLATPVTAGVLDTILRTQRRRELGVGS
jgi:hypothetical protein